jgi:hypothetical protein
MWSILRGDPAAIVSWGPYLLFAGIALFGLSLLDFDHGTVTGFLAIGLGASGGAFTKWRSERGLWMLAILFLLMNAFVYFCFCFGQVRDALRGVLPDNIALTVDVSLGALLLLVQMRFLVRVARANYYVT